MRVAKIIKIVLECADSVQEKHWYASRSLSEHKLLDTLYTTIRDSADKIAEYCTNMNWQKKEVLIPLGVRGITAPLYNEEHNPLIYLKCVRDAVESLRQVDMKDSTFQSILDEVDFELSSLEYKLKIENKNIKASDETKNKTAKPKNQPSVKQDKDSATDKPNETKKNIRQIDEISENMQIEQIRKYLRLKKHNVEIIEHTKTSSTEYKFIINNDGVIETIKVNTNKVKQSTENLIAEYKASVMNNIMSLQVNLYGSGYEDEKTFLLYKDNAVRDFVRKNNLNDEIIDRYLSCLQNKQTKSGLSKFSMENWKYETGDESRSKVILKHIKNFPKVEGAPKLLNYETLSVKALNSIVVRPIVYGVKISKGINDVFNITGRDDITIDVTVGLIIQNIGYSEIIFPLQGGGVVGTSPVKIKNCEDFKRVTARNQTLIGSVVSFQICRM